MGTVQMRQTFVDEDGSTPEESIMYTIHNGKLERDGKGRVSLCMQWGTYSSLPYLFSFHSLFPFLSLPSFSIHSLTLSCCSLDLVWCLCTALLSLPISGARQEREMNSTYPVRSDYSDYSSSHSKHGFGKRDYEDCLIECRNICRWYRKLHENIQCFSFFLQLLYSQIISILKNKVKFLNIPSRGKNKNKFRFFIKDSDKIIIGMPDYCQRQFPTCLRLQTLYYWRLFVPPLKLHVYQAWVVMNYPFTFTPFTISAHYHQFSSTDYYCSSPWNTLHYTWNLTRSALFFKCLIFWKKKHISF